MPKSEAVWGIDIGQSALKAMRCWPDEDDPSKLVVDAFDYIEHAKILSQPEADPELLIRDALKLFLSRNTVRGDHVAISVSGQSGLARFIKLPPVESRKIPDIVKYEAKQQIPFPLEDVVWDFQQLRGGSEDDGFALETEVGLFAMKRDQVMQALAPMDESEVEVDFIQLAPLAIYNAVVFDQLYDLPPPEELDPENPPESLVLLSVGTDNTDLVVTNGYRVWQRSIPLGGNHFSKALSKNLKLTFAKAEHLKRHATEADDPKAVFQAMRPVFNDMLTEVQRSIGFFHNIDREARVTRIVGLGNAMKLPGLSRFLSQNLKLDFTTLDEYRGLSGGVVTNAPAFKENLLSYAVCYGLCVQGMGKAALSTNLLPKEFITERIIRDKKPWAIAAVAGLLVGCTLNFLGHWGAWQSAHDDRYSDVRRTAEMSIGTSRDFVQRYEQAVSRYDELSTIGENLVSNVEGRLLWLEMLQAIKASLPGGGTEVDMDIPIKLRRRLHIDSLDCERLEDVNLWYKGIAPIYDRVNAEQESPESDATEAGLADATADPMPFSSQPPGDQLGLDDPAGQGAGPHGPGWIIQLTGYHYFNDDRETAGATFVRQTLIQQLKEGFIEVPDGILGESIKVRVEELGISYPVIVEAGRIREEELEKPQVVKRVGSEASDPRGRIQGDRTSVEDNFVKVRRFDFTVQFCWQETPPSARRAAKAEAEENQPGFLPSNDVEAGGSQALRRTEVR